MCAQPQLRLVQEYNDLPLLVRGRKFHWRTYDLVVWDRRHDRYVVLHNPGNLILAFTQYKHNDTSAANVLTNTEQQRGLPGFSYDELFMLPEELFSYAVPASLGQDAARSTPPQVTSRPTSTGTSTRARAFRASTRRSRRLRSKTAEAYRRLWPRLEGGGGGGGGDAGDGELHALPDAVDRLARHVRPRSLHDGVADPVDAALPDAHAPRRLRRGAAPVGRRGARGGGAEGSPVDAAELGGTPDVFDCYFGKHATKADPVPGLMHGHQYVNPAFTVLLNRRASAAPPCIGCPEK